MILYYIATYLPMLYIVTNCSKFEPKYQTKPGCSVWKLNWWNDILYRYFCVYYDSIKIYFLMVLKYMIYFYHIDDDRPKPFEFYQRPPTPRIPTPSQAEQRQNRVAARRVGIRTETRTSVTTHPVHAFSATFFCYCWRMINNHKGAENVIVCPRVNKDH